MNYILLKFADDVDQFEGWLLLVMLSVEQLRHKIHLMSFLDEMEILVH
jgi:hypothetical protein